MKRILSFLLLLAATVFTTAIHAQSGHFDWAKGYGSNQDFCKIKGSVADTEGNLYILGSFTNDATWDGERLLPIVPYGPHPNTINTLIAKISPEGEMLWKKVIHANNGQNSVPYDVKKVGDTAFACLVNVPLPMPGHYCYYLDTLLSDDWHDYPIPLSLNTTMGGKFTGLITFDFSGNVKDQHFMRVSFIDTLGNDCVYIPDLPERLESYAFYNPSFDIDSKGNIYISRQTGTDHVEGLISVEEGSAIGLKFWVDNRCVGTVDVRDGYHPRWVSQLLKFSPHLESLLCSRYVVQKTNSARYGTDWPYIMLDDEDNLYLVGNLHYLGDIEDTVVVDSTQNMEIIIRQDIDRCKGYMVCCNENLVPRYLVSLSDSILSNSTAVNVRSMFYSVDVDADSGLVFVSGYALVDTNSNYGYFYGGRRLPLQKTDGFVLVMDKDSGTLRSVAVVPSVKASNFGIETKHSNILVKGNRIFVQTQHIGGIQFPRDTIIVQEYDRGLSLTIFDYRGHVIGGVDYRCIHPDNRPGPIAVSDSVVYLSNLIFSNATFGDYSVPVDGRFLCVAKYVDTAFMSCYSGGSGDVRIVMAEDGNAFVAYPNPFRQRVNIEYSGQQPITAAYLTDIMGRTEQVELSANAPGRYTLDLTARPQAAYLLTLVTQDGHRHTVRLLKQSEVFGQ